MNRRQLVFIIIFNAIVSLVVALLVVWAVEARRPDAEQLAIATDGQRVNGGLPATDNSSAVDVSAVSTGNSEAVPTVAGVGEPSSAPTVTTVLTAPTPIGEQEVYIVTTGDSLSSIADRFGIPVSTIVEINKLNDPNFVFSGQRLVIPVSGERSAPAPAAATATPAQGTPAIAIRAVAAPGDLLAEAVQIVNDGDGAVNLNGWQLVSASGAVYTFTDLPLFPGNYVWVHSGSGDDTSIARYWRQTGAVWTSGAEVQLRSGAGEVIARYTIP